MRSRPHIGIGDNRHDGAPAHPPITRSARIAPDTPPIMVYGRERNPLGLPTGVLPRIRPGYMGYRMGQRFHRPVPALLHTWSDAFSKITIVSGRTPSNFMASAPVAVRLFRWSAGRS